MGNEIFEEIKRKYKKSNKYMLYVSYEDIGILIQIIETMNKRKLEDMTFEYFNDYELKAIVGKYLEDKLQEIYKNLIIEVNFKDFRLYEIIIKLEYQGVQYESKFEYKYDASLTIDANISTIVNIIDTQIIISFYKKGE